MLTFQISRPMNTDAPRGKRIPLDAEVVSLVDRDARPQISDPTTPEGIAAWRDRVAHEVCRSDFGTFEVATRIAESANKNLAGGERHYIPTDSGSGMSPRYDVVEMFKVGEPVSYTFNGDTYPDGVIVSIGSGRMAWITTSTGGRYHRQGLSGRWRKQGGTWSLCHGHHEEQNPHF